MAFLVGGYIVTYKDVEDWCGRNNLKLPNLANITAIPNLWLKEHNLPTRLLAVDYHNEPMIMVITNRKLDSNATRTNFTPFQQTERALRVKAQMAIEPQDFITIVNPFD